MSGSCGYSFLRMVRRALAFALCVLIAGTLLVEPTSAGSGVKERSPWSVRLWFEGEYRYNDNIIGLSEDLLKNSPSLDPDRFLIETPDDYILAPELGLIFKRSPWRKRDTSIVLTLRAYAYQRNNVKDYKQFALSVNQEINRSRKHGSDLSIGVSHIPSYFLRQLIDFDESVAQGRIVRNAATYSLDRAYIEFTQEIINRYFKASAGYAYEHRNYNEHFNERDSDTDEGWINITVYPLGNIRFRIDSYYRKETRNAHGDLVSTPVIDDDTDFNADHYGITLRGLWGHDADHRNKLTLWYGKEKREFLTNFTPDLSRFGREDDISLYRISYSREFDRFWELRVYYRYRQNDVSRPGLLGSTVITRFEKNIAALSVVYHYDSRN